MPIRSRLVISATRVIPVVGTLGLTGRVSLQGGLHAVFRECWSSRGLCDEEMCATSMFAPCSVLYTGFRYVRSGELRFPDGAPIRECTILLTSNPAMKTTAMSAIITKFPGVMPEIPTRWPMSGTANHDPVVPLHFFRGQANGVSGCKLMAHTSHPPLYFTSTSDERIHLSDPQNSPSFHFPPALAHPANDRSSKSIY